MFRTALIVAPMLLIARLAPHQAQAAGKRVEVNGMQMYYEVSGEGDPLVVLHGAYMNIPSMGAIIPKLAETHKVYALEFQGHGRTTDIDRPITYPNLADDVAAFMDAVGIAKADVFGYSMGAAAGLQLAIRHPDKVNKLVAASVAYDVEGWQPEFKAFIPQMTVEMIVGMPFAEEYREARRQPRRLPGAGREADRAREGADGVGGGRQGAEDAGADHRRRRRRGDARALGRAVPPARRRRHGRHGQAAARLAPRHPAGDVAHRRHQPARPAARLHRAVPEGRDAEGVHVTVYEAAGGRQGLLRLAEAWHRRVMADEVVSHAFSHGFHPRAHRAPRRVLGRGPRRARRRYSDTLRRRDLGGADPQRQRPARGDGPPGDRLLRPGAWTTSGSRHEPLRQVLHDYFAWATTTTMSRYHESADDVPDGLAIPQMVLGRAATLSPVRIQSPLSPWPDEGKRC